MKVYKCVAGIIANLKLDSLSILSVGCGPPTPPPRGSLGDLTSSQEGAIVTFQCNPGLVPSQQMMSVCAANGRWTPDSAELVCRGDDLKKALHIINIIPLVCSTTEYLISQKVAVFNHYAAIATHTYPESRRQAIGRS